LKTSTLPSRRLRTPRPPSLNTVRERLQYDISRRFHWHLSLEMRQAAASKTGALRTLPALWTFLLGTCLIPATLRALPAATAQQSDEMARKIFDLTNRDRAAHGLSSL